MWILVNWGTGGTGIIWNNVRVVKVLLFKYLQHYGIKIIMLNSSCKGVFYLWVLHPVAHLSNWFLVIPSIATEFQYITPPFLFSFTHYMFLPLWAIFRCDVLKLCCDWRNHKEPISYKVLDFRTLLSDYWSVGLISSVCCENLLWYKPVENYGSEYSVGSSVSSALPIMLTQSCQAHLWFYVCSWSKQIYQCDRDSAQWRWRLVASFITSFPL
jgi:hypothetical protein